MEDEREPRKSSGKSSGIRKTEKEFPQREPSPGKCAGLRYVSHFKIIT
jgi:hypothetical protein